MVSRRPLIIFDWRRTLSQELPDGSKVVLSYVKTVLRSFQQKGFVVFRQPPRNPKKRSSGSAAAGAVISSQLHLHRRDNPQELARSGPYPLPALDTETARQPSLPNLDVSHFVGDQSTKQRPSRDRVAILSFCESNIGFPQIMSSRSSRRSRSGSRTQH